tara:strand:+ start:234 stop:560 length:327 start_codon:yes stop_codon:yes gene_type:complete
MEGAEAHHIYGLFGRKAPTLPRNTFSGVLTQSDSWYESSIEQAKQMSDPKKARNMSKKNVTAQVPDSTHRRLSVLAARTDMSVAQHLRRAIDEYLDRSEDGDQADLGL